MTLHDRFHSTTVGNKSFAPATIAPARYTTHTDRSVFNKSEEEILTLKMLKKSAPKRFTHSMKAVF